MRKFKKFAWPLYPALFFVAALVALVAQSFSTNSNVKGSVSSCRAGQGRTIGVEVTNNGFWPQEITAHVCDKLLLSNKTDGFSEAALGSHDHHLAYPGFKETVLRPGEEMTVVLGKKGSYLVHDHLHDERHAKLVIQ